MKKNQGLIKFIIIILIALIVLGYYGFDIQKAIDAPATQSNLTYVQQVVSIVWHDYLQAPATYLWNIFVQYIWTPALNSLIQHSVQTIAPQATTATTTISQ